MNNILYQVHNGLYVNLTNRCPCACTFCLRQMMDRVGDSEPLWLKKEPELDAVIAGVNGKPSGIRKLTDDELEYAAGGVMAGGSSDDSQAYGRCTVKGCGGLLSPTLDGFICGSCKQKYNKDKTKWGGNLLEGNNNNNSGINPKFT